MICFFCSLFGRFADFVLRGNHVPQLVDDIHEALPLRHLVEDTLHLVDCQRLRDDGRFAALVVDRLPRSQGFELGAEVCEWCVVQLAERV